MGDVRWVVGPEDGETVGDVVRRAGADDDAIREGRVFVGRVRADDAGAVLRVGQVLTIRTGRGASPAAIVVLADDDGIVAVEKSSGCPTIPDHRGSAHSLLAMLAVTLGCAPADLHATSRLDRDVSGVVVFARTREAAERLAEARKQGTYLRRYVGIAGRAPEPARGAWEGPVGRAKDPRKRVVGGRDAVHARSLYEVVATAGGRALLALEPETGRTHQLRVHAAHAGAPLLGDSDYGGDGRIVLGSGRVLAVRRIALHAGRVVVPGSSGKAIEVTADVPAEVRELWTALGGLDVAWNAALFGPWLKGGPR